MKCRTCNEEFDNLFYGVCRECFYKFVDDDINNIKINKEEAQIILNYFQFQYIKYDEEGLKLHEILNKLEEFVNDNSTGL